MENENKGNQAMNNNPENGERTFTQVDVNRIVSDRLSRERDKRGTELDEREKALRHRELAVIDREKLDEAGLNKELYNVLRFDDEESLDEAINQLKNIQGFKAEKDKSEYEVYKPLRLPDIDHSIQDRNDTDSKLRKAMGLHG